MKSGNFNFLEPSGPLQACNGTDLPLHVLDTWVPLLCTYNILKVCVCVCVCVCVRVRARALIVTYFRMIQMDFVI